MVNLKTSLKVGLIAGASVLSFFIQTYFLPNAGQEKINKFSEYSYQMDTWGEEIYKKFDAIKYSDSYKKLSLYSGEKTVSLEFFRNIDEYHYQIKAMLRVLKLQGHVAINIMKDTLPLVTTVGEKKGIESIKKVSNDYKLFEVNLKNYDTKISEIEAYLPNLIQTFSYNSIELNQDKVELSIKQIDLLNQLYSSENLFLKHGSDPFEYVRNFADTSKKVLHHYQELNDEYNKIVKQELRYKNSIILFVMFLSAFFAFRKDLET
jgi:hypothetical protein